MVINIVDKRNTLTNAFPNSFNSPYSLDLSRITH
jgi:hypothetical protein